MERTVAGLLELIRLRGLGPTIGVARDERPAGEALSADVIRVARAHGADVVDFGVVMTPSAKLAARNRRLGGAVIVTGSHLDPELNGLKLVAAPAYGPVDVRELPEPGSATSHEKGRLWREEGAAREHVSAIVASIDGESVRAAAPAVDCSGGAGTAARLLLEALGCRSPSGEADVALRLDADGDRLEVVDEYGIPMDLELTLPLVAIAREAQTIVKGADTSRMIDALARERGGTVVTVPPGEIHLIRGVREAGADLAGEGNGGVVVPQVGLARDGLAAAASVLWLLARAGESPSSLAAELPRYARRRSTTPCPDLSLADGILAALASRLDVEPPQRDLGVRVERDGAWGLVRLSATEPVLRITVEARQPDAADHLHAELQDALQAEIRTR